MGINRRFKYGFRRAFAFNQSVRACFYATLREYTRSRFALLQIFDAVQQQESMPAFQEIARLSKKAIRNNQPFAAHYHEAGFFNETETALLILGERHDCLAQAAQLLLDNRIDRGAVVLRVLAPCFQWLFLTLVMIVLSLYALPYLQAYSRGYQWFFDGLLFIQTWWLPLALAAAVIALLYRWALYRLGEPARGMLRRLGCFNLYAMLLELQFLAIAQPLVRARLPAGEFLLVMQQAFRRDRLFVERLEQGRRRLTETSLAQVLEGVLSPRTCAHIKSCAPNETPEELASGCEAAARMLQIQLDTAVAAYRFFYLLASLGVSLLVTIPFALAAMGMGMQL